MAKHTFLSLDKPLIKINIRNNLNSFGLLSNDGSRCLIDGYNYKGELVTDLALKNWIKIPDHTQADIAHILDTAIEYTSEEFKVEKLDVNSIWYVGNSGIN